MNTVEQVPAASPATTPATTPAHRIAQGYLAAWNEADAGRRARRISEAFEAEASYIDPRMQGRGHEGLNTMIGAAREHFPGHVFSLYGTPDLHGNRLRFSWSLAPSGAVQAAPVARGTDFATLSVDGRLQEVTGFLDQVPAAA